MDFKQFYINSQRRSLDALMGLWASGNKGLQDELRECLTSREPLVALPVFQSMFPWQLAECTFGSLSGSLFHKDFVNGLDSVIDPQYQFPRTRQPFAHQLASWKHLIEDKKSIVVTSGTGSGKTECFMFPVLNDLYQKTLDDPEYQMGIGAIFLYPLNALINSQRNRLKAWTGTLQKRLRFAIYNGNTPDPESSKKARDEAFPEIIDRHMIRNEPPQVLFTNPTMLEYMLIRDRDQSILQKSQGKLRWIILDEAHTYIGSQAAEMALLIRRTLDAFGVKSQNVRFVATSATIGGGDVGRELTQFLADMSGKAPDQIAVVGGSRIVPELPAPSIHAPSLSTFQALSGENRKKCHEAHQLRLDINKYPAIGLNDIGKRFGADTLDDCLDLVNLLSDEPDDDSGSEKADALIPMRGHFFQRTIPGVYSCVNSKCKAYSDRKMFTNLTTRVASLCPECNSPLLEIVSCTGCGALYWFGEKNMSSDSVRTGGRRDDENDFLDLEDTENEEAEEAEDKDAWDDLWLSHRSWIPDFDKKENLFACDISAEGKLVDDGPFLECHEGKCPNCHGLLSHARHFRASSPFIARFLMPTVLEQAPEALPEEYKEQMLWGGRKVIAFTDNRQQTARSSAQINAEVERTWTRSQVYHILLQKYYQNSIDEAKIKGELAELRAVPAANHGPAIQKMISDLEKQLANPQEPPIVKWSEIVLLLADKADLNVTFIREIERHLGQVKAADFAMALLLDQFGRRPKRENSPETMGLIQVVYPEIMQKTAPDQAIAVGLTHDEWKDYLKICLDFYVRENYHFITGGESVDALLLRDYYNRPIYHKDNLLGKRRPWPEFVPGRERQHRLALILCAGLGFTDIGMLTEADIDKVKQLMELARVAIWPLLFRGRSPDDGGLLDLQKDVAFRLLCKAWICPITQRPIDIVFRGYSPWLTGRLSPENIDRFKVSEPIDIDIFPWAFNEAEGGAKIPQNQSIDWISRHFSSLRNSGVWTDIHERILLCQPIFMSGEHSAQQSPKRLSKLEKGFSEGKVNVLNCSTTMELGVDIGGVSIVLMNNVPPTPANYLQRTGRAGRRKEKRSMAFTICGANPIGEAVMANPRWAMDSPIAVPRVAFSSKPLIQRHVNALMLGTFVRANAGLKITENAKDFFGSDAQSGAPSKHMLLFEYLASVCGNETMHATINMLTDRTVLHDASPSALIESCKEILQTCYLSYKRELERIQDDRQKLCRNGDFASNDSPGLRALKHQENILQNKKLLKYLAEKGFLPSYGFPTNVVEFNTVTLRELKKKSTVSESQREDDRFRSNGFPSRGIAMALSEFAPGGELVLDGWAYKSGGILMQTIFQDTDIMNIRQCRTCGHQEMVYNVKTPCAVCGNGNFKGVLDDASAWTEAIQPAGFAVDLYEEPTRKTERNFSSRRYTEPLLLGMGAWSETDSYLCDFRIGADNAKILYYNKGAGMGFSVCTACGKAETMPSANSEKVPLEGHKRLRGGREKGAANSIECIGNTGTRTIRKNVVLAGSVSTDICELRLRNVDGSLVDDECIVWTLGVTLRQHFTRYLGANDGEIQMGVHRYNIGKTFRTAYLYDTASGGIGLSTQLPMYLHKVLEIIRSKLAACDCEKACSKCLIDRQSQWDHEKLDRKVLLNWLDKKLVPELPKEMAGVGASREWFPLHQAIMMRLALLAPKEIRFFIDGTFAEWDLVEWPFTRELKRCALQGTSVRFVVPFAGKLSPDISRLLVKQLGDWAIVEQSATLDKSLPGCPLIQIADADGTLRTWLTLKPFLLPPPQADWAEHVRGEFFAINRAITQLPVNTPIRFETKTESNVFCSETDIKLQNMMVTNFGPYIRSACEKALGDRHDKVKKQKAMLLCSDRYLNTPASAILLCEVLTDIVKQWGLVATDLTISTWSMQCHRGEWHSSSWLSDRFTSDAERNSFICLLIKSRMNIDIKVIAKEPQMRIDVPHYRYLEIKTDKMHLRIRPDGGIDHGWQISGLHLPKGQATKAADGLNEYLEQRNRMFVSSTQKGVVIYSFRAETF